MYYLFLERLFAIFDSTPLHFQPLHIRAARIVLLLYCIGSSVMIIFLFDGDADASTNRCYADIPLFTFAIAIVGDIAGMLVVSILFSRRLLLFDVQQIAGKMGAQKSTPQRDESITRVLDKSTILTFVAFLTTQCSFILMAVIGVSSLWISLDSMVCTESALRWSTDLVLTHCGWTGQLLVHCDDVFC